jgi:hypothetical protein
MLTESMSSVSEFFAVTPERPTRSRSPYHPTE